MTETQFRWRFSDDAIGDQWSRWHSLELPCAACCCGGPDEGEHQEGAEYYSADGPEGGSVFAMERGHARYDPIDPDWDREVEWR